MAVHRSRAEVYRLYKIAIDTQLAIGNMIMMWKGPVPGALFDASRGLDSAVMEYYRPVTLERTFNALRDAVTQAEAEINKYRRLMKEQSE